MFKTKKTLGQNFLVNPHILDRIITTAEISSTDTILEIGPGLGNLTSRLAAKAKEVVAIEKDHRLIPILKENLKEFDNIKIIEADILKLQPTALLHYLAPDLLQPTALLRYCASYKIVANIPYYLTSHLLREIFEEWPQPKLIVLTIQKEVAQRILAKPPHMNLLALSVQYYSKPEIISYISKNNFRPTPKVDSAIIRLTPRKDNYCATALLRYKLFQLMRVGFSEKRKQLASVLSKKLKIPKEELLSIFEKEGIEPNTRPENLSLEQWQKLSKIL